ncbi:MAG: DUF2254 domain-containing protein [Capsulimonadaceae bacterium]
MKTRLPAFFRHVVYNLRGGFLVRPLIIALALGCAGAVLSMMEVTLPVISAWVPSGLFPSRSDPQVAQVILETIASSMMTVVSIVFAILLMTLTLASMQYSPRILVSFAQDKVTQQTLGIFLGTFTYCLAALPATRLVPHPVEPVVTVLGAMLLALACVAWLLYFIHHISQAIGVNYIVDRIARETEAIIDQTMPYQIREKVMPDEPLPPMDTRKALIPCGSSGYVRYIDTKRLVSLAKSYGITIYVMRRVGHFVPRGVPLMAVSNASKLSPDRIAELLAVFDLGPTRTLEQDIEFGVLQIVDIALKAISPAVNDPTTAISCVDQLSRVLIRFCSRERPETRYYDPPGIVRVSIPWLGFDRITESAFEQIRHYAQTDVAVSLRLLRALIDIATTVSGATERNSLVERGRQIVSGCAKHLPDEELVDLRARLTILEELASHTLRSVVGIHPAPPH